MKKLMTAAVAAIAVLTATPSFAADAHSSSSLAFSLNGSVSEICGVYSKSGTTVPIAFGDLATVADSTLVTKSLGDVSYRCNDANGFTRVIHSANGGKLVRTGGSGDQYNSIAYIFNQSGNAGISVSDTSLSADVDTTFAGSHQLLEGQRGTASFKLNGVFNTNSSAGNAPGTTVFAGDYTDTVTITVTGA
ncbi:hypothetical protein EAH79_07490 [Sphingomonas koreensis]|nr:hypothetical protein EAH79_07490 [Sphingomonas koreensis]